MNLKIELFIIQIKILFSKLLNGNWTKIATPIKGIQLLGLKKNKKEM